MTLSDNRTLSGLFVPAPAGMIPVSEDDENPVVINPTVVILNEVTDEFSVMGRAYYNNETNVLTVVIPDYFKDWTINLQRFNSSLRNGHTDYSQENIGTCIIDMLEIPACVWYVPCAIDLEDGALQVPDYPYAKPTKRPMCTNPELNPHGLRSTTVACNYSGNCTACSVHAVYKWSPVATAYVDDQPVGSLDVIYRGPRIPEYRVSNSETTTYRDMTEARNAFKTYTDSLNADGESVQIIEAGREVTKYLDVVLAV